MHTRPERIHIPPRPWIRTPPPGSFDDPALDPRNPAPRTRSVGHRPETSGRVHPGSTLLMGMIGRRFIQLDRRDPLTGETLFLCHDPWEFEHGTSGDQPVRTSGGDPGSPGG